jgi:N-acetylglucosamine-6-phosphate deacetylase
MLTVAAEIPGIEALVRSARSRGVAISVGHSLYGSDALDRLYSAGASALTHLGNGLPNVLPRHDNPIWAGLADERFAVMAIADGHHLPVPVLKVVVRAAGAGRLVVVSDASPVAGLPPGEYQVLGNRAILEPTGRLHNPEKQCLVGSAVTMLDCMNTLASLGLLTVSELLQVGVTNPLRAIGVDPSAVRRGSGLWYREGAFAL